MQQPTVMEAAGSVPTLCSKSVLSLPEPEWLQVYWSHTIPDQLTVTYSSTLQDVIEQAHFLIRLTASFHSSDKHLL